ncbi:hypothetical protein DENSPDRAFT_878359 [Dentipellis sp. KUC8613]|nr:hypothetical protein DENSPDRAFT_878359 [Dentipellis sp. KUC8613]
MSNIQRSKSAPHVSGLAPLVEKAQRPQLGPRRTKTTLDFLEAFPQARRVPSGYTTPRSDREDPFNMGGFFPPQLRTDEEAAEWRWLKDEEADDEAEGSHTVETAASDDDAASGESLFGEVEEANADAVIRDEDKLGILSILEMFVGTTAGRGADEQLWSPYDGDEACDEVSLHLALSRLRAGSAGVAAGDDRESSWELFLPGQGEERKDRQWLQLLSGMGVL